MVDFRRRTYSLLIVVDLFGSVIDSRKMFIVVFVCIVIAASTVNCETDFKYDEGVLVLTKQTFPDAVNEFEFILVEFCKYK